MSKMDLDQEPSCLLLTKTHFKDPPTMRLNLYDVIHFIEHHLHQWQNPIFENILLLFHSSLSKAFM